MKLVVVGKGQIARAIASRAVAHEQLSVTLLTRPQFDLERPDAIAPLVAAATPDIVINAAAYTAVDKAETEPARAFAVNAVGAEAVALASLAVGAPIVQLSTDYVFNGEKRAPYVETDPTGPASAYGASKLEGERRVFAAHPGAVIVRTSWVYDAVGINFVRTMLRLAGGRESVAVVVDQVGCPTYADDIADALLMIAVKQARSPGIYHCAGAGSASWADFANEIFQISRARGGPFAQVLPIPSSEYNALAPRPANSQLDCSKLANDYGIWMRPWKDALMDCIDGIAASGWRVE